MLSTKKKKKLSVLGIHFKDWLDTLSSKNDKRTTVAHRQKSSTNHMFLCVTHCLVSAIRHAEKYGCTNSQLPLGNDWTHRDTGMRQMFSLCLQRGSHDVLLAETIHVNMWLIFHAWLKPHSGMERGLSSQKSMEVTIVSHWRLLPNCH